MKIFVLFLIILFFIPFIVHAKDNAEDSIGNWKNLENSVNNAFFFVVDKIISIQAFFITEAYAVGRLVLFIALLSAGLNYVLTGTGFKENMIKIMKASVFFLIVIAAYPKIIGWITNYTYNLAYNSLGSSVEQYYNKKMVTMNKDVIIYSGSKVLSDGTGAFGDNGTYTTNTYNTIKTLTAEFEMSTPELQEIFSNIKQNRSVKVNKTTLSYTSFAPAAVVQLLLVTANSAFSFADEAKKNALGISEFSVVIKGLICGFFLIFTGVFALIEYLICLIEFMLIASVGIILFPTSIWDGSKFLSEKFIGALVGFFMKLLFCNIAIFLLLYGYVSMFHIIGTQKFGGSIDQIAFIIFSCLLFFFICKSAPALAQSLLTGTPSLNAAGAIGAAAGAISAVATTAGIAQRAGGAVANAAGAVAGGGARAVGGAVGSITEANAAKTAAMSDVAAAGGSSRQIKQAGNFAFASSMLSDVGDSFKSGALGLARSISGGKGAGFSGGGGGNNPHSWRDSFNNTTVTDSVTGKERNQTIGEHLTNRKDEGTSRGKNSALNYIAKKGL